MSMSTNKVDASTPIPAGRDKIYQVFQNVRKNYYNVKLRNNLTYTGYQPPNLAIGTLHILIVIYVVSPVG
jgi:hypothetical protein